MPRPQVPIVKTPALLDSFIIPYNEELKNLLPWLDFTFGQTEKVFDKSKKDFKPICYAGKKIKGEYANLFPDEFFGTNTNITGYCFWVTGDVNLKIIDVNSMGNLKSECSIIFWFNVDKVLNDREEYRNIDKVVNEILQALKKANWKASGQAMPTKYTKDPAKIFDMFPTKDIRNRFFTYPFFGVRFYLDLNVKNKC